jgi:gliding motility-associated-like protein
MGLFLTPSNRLDAQTSFFNFTPPANTIIAVGQDCSASLATGGLAAPVVTSTVGANITVSAFDPVASGYLYTDLWPAPYNALIVSWKVSDDQGHTANFIFVVSIIDVSPPVFTTTSFPTPLQLSSVVQVPMNTNIPVNDNCTGLSNLVRTFNESPRPDTCDAGTFTRTWTAKDASGNISTYIQTIIIYKDSLPPSISVFPQNGSASCTQLSTAFPAWLATQMANFTASDPSGIKSLTNNAPPSFPPGCKVPLTVTFRATDNCGIAIPTTAVFSTADTQPPVILSAPKDTVAYCTGTGSPLNALGAWINKKGYLQTIDSCTEQNLLQYEMRIGGLVRDSAQVVAALLASYANGCDSMTIGAKKYAKVRGKVTVTFFVRDACGNTKTAGASTFGVIDTVPPAITGVNTTELCGGNDNASLTAWINAHGNAIATDGCSGTSWTGFSWVTSTGNTGSGNFGTGPYPSVQALNCSWWVDVTFRASDDCGNINQRILRFQIFDNVKPVIAGFPPVVTLPCTNPNPSLSPAFVSDNCDNSMVITYTAINKDSTCAGSYNRMVTWFATDDCGNTGTATQLVQVRDTVGPLFTLVPAPVTMRCDTFSLPPVPMMGQGINANDACSPVTGITTQTISAQNPNPAVCAHYTYNITRIFTATDACGNTRTATQVISVVDNQGPNIYGYLDTTTVCEKPPVMPAPKGIDPCSGPTAPPVMYQELIDIGPCADTYTRVRYWQASDVCGNTATFSQNIHVIDTVPPTLTGIPANITVACNNIPTPANMNAFGRTDNCDNDVSISFLEYEVRDPNLNSCAHWTNYQIKREWTAKDNCKNERVYTQTLTVEDNTGPVIVAPNTVSLPSDFNMCGANLVVPAPISLYDDCTTQYATYNLKDTVKLTMSGSGNPFNTPVDTVVFQWNTPNLPPLEPVINAASFTVLIDNADINASTEYFNIYGEGGAPIGSTEPNITPVTCTSAVKIFTIPANLLNLWMADGDLTIKLVTNGSGNAAVNPTCPNGRVRCSLLYQTSAQYIPVDLSYSIDNKPALPFPPSSGAFFDVGNHTVVYKATDCAGNTTTVSASIVVSDTQAPQITSPAPITSYIGPGNCTVTLPLPFPNISENCDVSGVLDRASATLPIQFQYDPDADTIPIAIALPINGLIPNAIGPGRLRLRFRGDNGDTGEFFTINDEFGQPVIPATQPGIKALECSTTYAETVMPIPANKINSWAQNGNTFFTAIANNDVFNFPDAINNCNPLLPDKTDGISRIQASLEYSYAEITYEIRKNNALYLPPGPLIGNQTNVTLEPGVYQVKYVVSDNHGLEGTTTFTITVRDTIKPKAFCLPTTIYTNPSGLAVDHTFLQPSTINNGSTDNCPGTLTLQLSQTEFTCNMATTPPSNIYPITLTVTDAAGNKATCNTTVQVLIADLKPYYFPVCEGGTLRIFTDSTLSDPNTIYSFSWKNPSGSIVFPGQRNPIKTGAQLSDEGLYSVSATGSSGCVAKGVVDIKLTKLPGDPKIQTNSPICQGDSIYLSNNSNLQNAWYRWYSVAPSGIATLLDSTQTPFYVIPNPLVGNYNFYMKISADGCSSINSPVGLVIVKPRPTAVIDPPSSSNIRVCFGQPIVLGTNSQAPGMTYLWTGPNGFMNTQQSPPVILSAAYTNAGTYKLVTTLDNCPSIPDILQITVDTTPTQPIISGQNAVCVGGSTTLISNVMGNGYIWERINPAQQIVTTSNALVLNNLTLADNACWRVRVVRQFCTSDWSNTFCIDVKAYPDVAAPPNISICNGDTLKLTATSNQPNLPFWAWTGPAEAGSGPYATFQQNPIRTPGVPGTYKVIGKNANGCADSAFISVLISPAPVIDTVTNNAPPCPDGTSDVTLIPTITSASPPLMYSWYHPSIAPGNLFSTDPMPVITDVAGKDNGTYLLVVKDNFGCVSSPKSTTINVGNPLDLPILKLDTQKDTVCVGATVTISIVNAGSYQTPTYVWTVPYSVTPITTTLPFLNIPSAQLNNTGTYQVQVQSGTCQSPVSAVLRLTVYAYPTIPFPQSNSPVCEGGTLNLWVSNVNSNPNAQYYWWGPAGWSSTTPNPNQMIPSVTENQEGNYNVKVTLNGCTTFAGEPIFVMVDSLPKKPVIQQPDPTRICKEYALSFINLLVSNTTQGAQYTWIHVEQNDTIAGPLPSGNLYINNLSQFSAGKLTFQVVASKNGCNSLVSESVSLYLDTIPDNQADAGPSPRTLCTNQELRLTASAPTAGITGKWKQVGTQSLTIVNPDDPNTQLKNFSPEKTYMFVWSLTNGGCINFDTDTSIITTVAPEIAMVPQSFVTGCSAYSVEIQGIQGQKSKGYWVQDENQTNALMIGMSNPDSTVTSVTNLVPGGKYFFYWTLPDIGCGVSSSKVTVLNFSGTYAGADHTICNSNGCDTLSASKLQDFETGKWSSNDPQLTFQVINPNTAVVCNLQPGPNTIYWTTNHDSCGVDSRDTVVVNYQLLPTGVADLIDVQYGSTQSFNLTSNDILPGQYLVSIIAPPSKGVLELISNGVYTYRASAGFTGSDELIYEVCNYLCPDPKDCSRITSIFKIGDPGDCVIPSIITPNNDNINETFIIPSSCFVGEGVVDVEVSIFNEWGDIVYHNAKYDNNKGWDGKYNGADLPVGTYFYVVEIQDQSKPKTGFVLIQR